MPGQRLASVLAGGFQLPIHTKGSDVRWTPRQIQDDVAHRQAEVAATNPLAKPGDIAPPPPITRRFDPDPGNGDTGMSPEDMGLAACGMLTGWRKTACELGARVFLPDGNTGSRRDPLVGREPCPTGYHTDPSTGGCVIDGPGRFLPGDVGMADYVWTPQNGRYGAGLTPIAVQSSRRVCPPGHVLGDDGLCYDRLAKSRRAWNPGTKPLLTGGDMNALQRAHRLQKSIGKISRRFGPKKKASCACGTGKRKK